MLHKYLVGCCLISDLFGKKDNIGRSVSWPINCFISRELVSRNHVTWYLVTSDARYITNIFWGRIEYELIDGLRGAKHWVDYSVHIRFDQERYLFYYMENYWNKNCKPKTVKSLKTNQHFRFLNLLQTLIKQPGSPPALFITCQIWPGMRYNSYKCKLIALFKNNHYCNSLPITILQFIIPLKLLFNIEKW